MMTLEEIRNTIPHRYPLLLVDRVLEIELNKSLRALKNVTATEIFFNGHFPDHAIMPGVLIVEALAQSLAILATKSYQENNNDLNNEPLFLLTGIDDTRFKRMVIPGDQLILDVELISNKHKIFKGRGIASVNGEIACTTTLMSIYRKIEN
jgi:3-hydroxyacyl-[acyl-carrier-protein] dehydratase